jgi:general secretion pathway protein K
MNNRRTFIGRANNCSGVAIIIVLWVVMVLSLLISGFAFTMHVETQVASFARKELKAEMLARSGIEVARMELILHQQASAEAAFDALNQDWATNEDLYVDHELGDGIYNVKITDEESKIPINRATDLQLKRLLDLLGVDPFDADVIVDSIFDWIDADDLTRLNGAESDYYQSLSPPYRAKNAPMDRVEELLLVRGVTPELYHGTATEDQEAHPSFPELFTTMSSGKVNVNTASSIVLQAMLNLDDQQVQGLLSRRDGPDGIPGTEDDQPFQSVADLTQWIGGLGATNVANLVDVHSSFFTVKSTGEVGGVKRTLIATLRREGTGTNIQAVAWCEVRGGT